MNKLLLIITIFAAVAGCAVIEQETPRYVCPSSFDIALCEERAGAIFPDAVYVSCRMCRKIDEEAKLTD